MTATVEPSGSLKRRIAQVLDPRQEPLRANRTRAVVTGGKEFAGVRLD